MIRNKRIFAVVVALVLCLTLTLPLTACSTSRNLTVSFNSSHKVHEGDPLESLKPYLKVNYTDAFGKTAEIKNYTLSGELTVGNSVITVKYNGLSKTTTIEVLPKPVEGGGSGNTGDNTGTGGNMGDNTGDNTGGTGDNTGGNTGDSTGGNTGDNTGDNTGGDNTGDNTGGTGDNTGGNSGDNTGGNTGDNTGGNTGNPDDNTGNDGDDDKVDVTKAGEGTLASPYNVSQALTLAGSLASNNYSTNTVYVIGIVLSDSTTGEEGDHRFYMYGADQSSTLYIYYATCNVSGVTTLKTGDIVVVCGYLYNFRGTTLEMAKNNGIKPQVVSVLANNSSSGDDDDDPISEIELTLSSTFVEINSTVTLTLSPSASASQVEYVFSSGQSCVTTSGLSLTAKVKGSVSFYVRVNGKTSNRVGLQIVDPGDDPYKSTNFNTFHGSSYSEASSLEDSYWRSKHNLMSGSIANQNEAPTVASSQPKSGNKYVRNSDATYIDNGNTYVVVDSRGQIANKIYKFGAYVTLEDVAAYVYAFGDIPANYIASNSTSSLSGNAWKQFLRLNHNKYSNNTTSYQYQPKLPETGPSGKLQYYEIDIGTTGTTAGGSTPVVYNTGSKITRGAARIVYTRFYSNDNEIDDLEYRYVFYTYNHYNDFQEYLNYQNGWGKIFGNVSNGGTLNKGSNPSPYVEVLRQKFSELFG